MNAFDEIIQKLLEFRDERDWAQFHDSKNFASAISIEAAELNELFLWKNENESEQVPAKLIQDELADILSFCFLLANKHKLDIRQILLDKIQQNELKYPSEKAKGKATKYDKL